MIGATRRTRKRTSLSKRTSLALGLFLGLAASLASAQAKAKPCVSTPATIRPRLSTKLALSQVTSPVLPSWSPSAPVKKAYPIVAFIQVDDCGVPKVKAVRTPHPDYKPVAKDLEAAIVKALVQWRFKPYEHQGRRMHFEFALPFTVSYHGVDLDSSVRVDTQPIPR